MAAASVRFNAAIGGHRAAAQPTSKQRGVSTRRSTIVGQLRGASERAVTQTRGWRKAVNPLARAWGAGH